MADPAARSTVPEQPGRKFWPWPGVIFLLLGGQMVVITMAVVLSTRDPSFAIEPDYYQKSLHWDEQAAQIRANRALGWHVSLDIAPQDTPAGRRPVTVIVTDTAGRPLDGAGVESILFHHAGGQDRMQASFQPEGAGRYSAKLLLRKAGIWEFRLTIRRGTDVFTTIEQREVAGRPGGGS
jgi:nitrogen fixation protein FixH